MNTTLTVANDFAEHLDRLRRLPEHADPSLRTLFKRQSPIYIARAPGRLDIMGGIGDYSGSLVLELPIAEAAFAAVQVSNERDVTIASLRRQCGNSRNCENNYVIRMGRSASWRLGSRPADSSHVIRHSAWAAYVAGPVLVLLRETQSSFDGGLRILIDSQRARREGRQLVGRRRGRHDASGRRGDWNRTIRRDACAIVPTCGEPRCRRAHAASWTR